MSPWRLLLTRPADECEALAAALAEAGVHSASLPLMAIEPVDETAAQRAVLQALAAYCAVIVVSKPAARLGLARLARDWPQLPSGPAWFSVGAATGAILQAHGLAASWPSAGDDSEALLALPELIAALDVEAPRVLILRGEGGRELIAETLRGRGARVDTLELYRRVLPAYPPGALVQAIDSERLNGLVVSSGQGLQSLHHLAGAAWTRLRELPLFVPSPRVAEMAAALGAERILDCRGAGTAALLAALRGHPEPAS